MFFNEAHEVGRCIASQRRLGEVRIGGKKILRAGVEVGEIAAAAAGDQNLLADAIRAFQYQHTAATLAGFDGTHQPGSAGSENDDVVFPIHAEVSLAKAAESCAVCYAVWNLSGVVSEFLSVGWHQNSRLTQDLHVAAPARLRRR